MMSALPETGQAPETNHITVQHLDLADYESTWRNMQAFTAARMPDTVD